MATNYWHTAYILWYTITHTHWPIGTWTGGKSRSCRGTLRPRAAARSASRRAGPRWNRSSCVIASSPVARWCPPHGLARIGLPHAGEWNRLCVTGRQLLPAEWLQSDVCISEPDALSSGPQPIKYNLVCASVSIQHR